MNPTDLVAFDILSYRPNLLPKWSLQHGNSIDGLFFNSCKMDIFHFVESNWNPPSYNLKSLLYLFWVKYLRIVSKCIFAMSSCQPLLILDEVIIPFLRPLWCVLGYIGSVKSFHHLSLICPFPSFYYIISFQPITMIIFSTGYYPQVKYMIFTIHQFFTEML